MVGPLWRSLGREILAGPKHDSPACSIYLSPSILLSCYCTYLERLTFMEEGGTSETIVPPSNSNENENSEEGSGENFVSLFPPFYYATVL